ncbi:MAG TPA: chemotaxis protein CheB [Flavobacterium sp.]|jgi:two-component system CheB/CheR fusion protein
MSSSTENEQEILIKSKNLFPVVGIGASAGGLDAFKKVLSAIPAKSGMAFVLVQHLTPTQESILPELLQRVTPIEVKQISDDLKVEPNTIYIIPSNKMLTANDGVLQLSPRSEASAKTKNMPIDLFFSSLAEVHQEHAIGVILSGLANDGTLGLKSIKDHGGITFAQDEDSAEFDGMPTSAIQAGVVDFVLPPEDIIARIIEIKRKITRSDDELLNLPKQEEDIYKQTLTILRMRKGTDFTFYKQATIRRRILRRIALTNKSTSAEYLKYLRENTAEQDILHQNLLIPVTEFFRDHKIFDSLCNSIFPEILKNKANDRPIRIWLAGCSTGQEVYSMAICLKEFLGSKTERVQIFATDISEPAIAKARSGIYTKQEVAGLSNYRLSENFIQNGDNYQVNKALRDMCVFALHNFLKDPPFGNLNFISCRNVLIYMEPYLQKKAFATFHYALIPKGFLLLGKSESINTVPDLFAPFNQQHKIFIRKDAQARYMHVATTKSEMYIDNKNSAPEPESAVIDYKKTTDEILLNKYTPSGVVVNDVLDIIQFRGNTSSFLAQMSGKPSHNLMKLAKPELAFELRNLLMKVKKVNKTVIKDNIRIKEDGQHRIVTIEALPLPNTIDPHYLVLFRETLNIEANPRQVAPSESSEPADDYKDARIKQLEMELAQIRDDMRTVTEEQEAANEELQSANEELLSGSEELQSLNEELETGKEELQSTNEELTVMNQEMLSLNEQLTDAIDYAESVVATIHEPLVVLDAAMKVRSANKAFYTLFGVSPEDTEGESIFQIGNQQWNDPVLQTMFKEILPKHKNLVNHEVTFFLPQLGMRTILLNAKGMRPTKSKEPLILVVLQDVTERLLLEQKENQILKRFKSMLIHAPVAVLILKAEELRVELANDCYLKSMCRGREIIGMSFFKALPKMDNLRTREILSDVLSKGTVEHDHEVGVVITENKINKSSYFDFVYQPMYEADKTISGIIIVANNITDQVVARKRMELQAVMTHNLFMTAPGFVCTLVGSGHVYDLVNERYQQLFGKRAITGKPILEALPELEGQGFVEILDSVYNTGETYLGIDIPIMLAHDVDLEPELRYFNFSYQPMYNEDNKIYAILVFGYEVTEEFNAKNDIIAMQQKHANDLEMNIAERTAELSIANTELIHANTKLLKANRELESFNYISSHDLQEPLRKIQMFTSRILESPESADMTATNKDYFLRIQSSAWRMQTLIQDLLSYAHVSIVERKFEKLDLAPIFNDVLNDLSEYILETRAVVNIGPLCHSNIDASQFRQVINNLIGNALKYVKPGETPEIDVACRIATGKEFNNPALDRNSKYCNIKISDNGIGIDAQYHDKIFEVFQRLHQTVNYAGTGIGLAIVKKLIENHNGVIEVTSKLGEGSTFDIYIPEY